MFIIIIFIYFWFYIYFYLFVYLFIYFVFVFVLDFCTTTEPPLAASFTNSIHHLHQLNPPPLQSTSPNSFHHHYHCYFSWTVACELHLLHLFKEATIQHHHHQFISSSPPIHHCPHLQIQFQITMANTHGTSQVPIHGSTHHTTCKDQIHKQPTINSSIFLQSCSLKYNLINFVFVLQVWKITHHHRRLMGCSLQLIKEVTTIQSTFAKPSLHLHRRRPNRSLPSHTPTPIERTQ